MLMLVPVIIKIFFPIVLGYLVKEIKYIDEKSAKYLRILVVRITAPALIFTSIYKSDITILNQLLPVSISFVFITLVLFIIAFLITIPVKDKSKRIILMWGLTFSNYAWIGWAVLKHSFGQAGLNTGVFFVTFWWPTLLIGGFLIALLNKGINVKKFPLKEYLLNIIIPIISLILGFTFNISDIKVPGYIFSPLFSFGEMTIPLILFTVGLSISFRDSLNNLKILIPYVVIKPILGLMAGLLVLFIINLKNTTSYKSIIILSTMPVATLIPVLGDMFNLDQKFISAMIIVSTVFSLITIPIVLYYVN